MESVSRRRCCRLRRRRSNDNLFCRFPLHTLQALLEDAAAAATATASVVNLTASQPGAGWTLSSSSGILRNEFEEVDFLPLEIVTTDFTVFYASYNGGLLLGPNSRKNAGLGATSGDWVEVPSCLCPDSPSEYVSIRILPAVLDATEIRLVPLSEKDYTRLHSDAGWLEGGGLLRQISLVYQDQVLEIRLADDSVARAHVVVSCDHGHEANERSEFEWPEDHSEESGQSNNEDSLCRRLVADARIVVVDPKPEQNKDDAASSEVPIRLWPVPCWQDYGPSMHALAHQMELQSLPKVPYGVGMIHPNGLAGHLFSTIHVVGTMGLVTVEQQRQLDDANSTTTAPTQTSVTNNGKVPVVDSLVIRLEPSELISPECIALHPLQCLALRLDPTSAEFSVLVVPLASFEVAQRSSRLLDWLESGKAILQLNPIRYLPLWASSSHCLVELFKNPKERLLDLAELMSLEEPSPVSTGSLIFWGNEIRQVELDFIGEEPLGNNSSTSAFFLFARDFVRLAQQKSSPITIFSEALENAAMLAEPTTPAPRMLSLLPEPTVCPAKLLSDSPKNWHDFNVLFYGPSGCGKTRAAFVLSAIARLRYQASTVYLDCRAEKNAAPQLQVLLRVLSNFMDRANSNGNRPCLIVLDDFDEICPNLLGQGGPTGRGSSALSVDQVSPMEMDQAKVVGDHIRNIFDNMNAIENIAIIVTCRDDKSVSWTFSRHHLLNKKFQLPLLTAQEKVSQLEQLLQVKNGEAEVTSGANSNQSSTHLPLEFQLHDLLPKDIEVLSSRILKEHLSQGTRTQLPFIIQQVLETYIPLSRRSAAEEPRDCFWNWNQDLGGLFKAKQTLVDLIVRPLRFRRIYATSHIRLPKGILLFGPPGCGKSIAPAALARELGLPLILCRGPEILDKYIGASEAKVRELFERATLSAPSILFLDELDALAPHRGSDLTGVTDRVVNQLLTFLDGVEDVSSGRTVYVMASSSRPDKIDSALLRPGRLEKHVYMGHPETQDELLDVFAKIASKYPIETSVKNDLLSGSLLSRFRLPQLMNMSPSDIKAIFDTAQIKAVREFLASGEDTSVATPCAIRESHLIDALLTSREGMSNKEMLRLQEIYDSFRHKTTRRPDPSNQRVSLK